MFYNLGWEKGYFNGLYIFLYQRITLFSQCKIPMFKSFWFSTNFKLSFERSSTIWENWLLCRIQMDPCGNGWGKLTLRQTVPHLQLSSSEYLTLYLSWYSEPFFSRLQKVFSALGWKYYIMLTMNFCILAIYFCTHEDLEQNPILLINSLMMCLKICEKFFWIIM